MLLYLALAGLSGWSLAGLIKAAVEFSQEKKDGYYILMITWGTTLILELALLVNVIQQYPIPVSQ